MRRIIIAILLLALVLAPLETLGVLKRGREQLGEAIRSSEAQALVAKFKIELPSLGEKVSGFFAKFFPNLNIGVKEVR